LVAKIPRVGEERKKRVGPEKTITPSPLGSLDILKNDGTTQDGNHFPSGSGSRTSLELQTGLENGDGGTRRETGQVFDRVF